MLIDEDNYLAHYGILRKSGRYPWGSGGSVEARSRGFLGMVEQLKAQGITKETDIAKGLGMTTTELRAAKSIAKNAKKQADIGMVEKLKEKGLSNVAIGERLGIPESTVRSYLAPGAKDKLDVLHNTANFLKDKVDTDGPLDIGTGSEHHVLGGISADRLKVAVAALKEQGYNVINVQVDQAGSGGQKTTVRVLAPPGVTYKDLVKDKSQIKSITGYTEDGGRSFLGLHPPLSIDSKRVGVRYAEDGGKEADGVIYVRPGVKDITMGNSRYAQVRIMVDGTHYIKGMAVYKDDLPKGVDLLFNTNKSNTGNKLDALKPIKNDPDNPFGSVVRQLTEKNPDGSVKRVTSAMNIVYEEGNWDRWSRTLSSQFLSKQSHALAKNQLDMAYESKKNELDEIMSLTNPAVRRKLLESFADKADSDSVHLKAAQLPRQSSHVILPVNSLKPTEIYAPNFRNGERVVLIRHPHGGPFEIPELTVNNRHPEAKRILGNTPDAVGIHHKVAEQLSGADFDGDTVIVIPNRPGRLGIKTRPPLKGLEGFDPQHSYPGYEGMPKIKPSTKQTEMGKISNLITDMSIRGATDSELAAAVRHSMVVIDAEKHNLDYRRSAIENGIPNLVKKYQSPYNPTGRPGASTLISRAKSRLDVPDRRLARKDEGGPIDPVTGRKVFVTKTDANGNPTTKTKRSTKLAEATDAHSLSSGTSIEKVYADHSNKLKSLANSARLAFIHTKSMPYSPSAKIAYSKEVESLNSKLRMALRNRPLERQARILADSVIKQKKQANPDMDRTEIKKLESQALAEARTRTGAKKHQIEITPDEWRAIQSGAISNHKLKDILDNTDLKTVKQLATPRTKLLMTSAKKARAANMLALGYTQAEVAQALGVSLTTLKTGLKEGG